MTKPDEADGERRLDGACVNADGFDMIPMAASFGPPGEADLPPEAPLSMPVQDLQSAPAAARGGGSAFLARRLTLIVGSALVGLAASFTVASLLALDGFDAVDQLMVLLSLALFSWIGFGFLNAAIGLVILLTGRNAVEASFGLPTRPIAVLMPVYNEDMAAVGMRIARMTGDLARLGAAPLFHFFVLSDSAATAEMVERTACRLLRRPDGSPIFYRRRPLNEARKPGNIADWIRRFGGVYDAMLILDADSRMDGDAMIRLAAAMETDPRVGLIQTTPLLTTGRTFFARWQQFATMLYGPISTAGLAWWSGDEATFWGHNAIVRVRAFAASCGLPTLPGREPLGGHIMSHDMVEAALLRRRGWKTRMMVTSSGSYEECPPTLIDHSVRDRRWCQGNLQHLRLIDTSGLHWISRLQLLMGASAYMTSPTWLFLLALGLLQSVRVGAPVLASGTPSWLIAGTIMLLFGTKAMALIWAAFDRGLVRQLGGWRSTLLGVLVDIPLSVLSAPVIMASQCQAILEIVSGRPSGWRPQRRDADGVTLVEAFQHYHFHVLLGVPFWLSAMADLGTGVWQLPVAIGLLGAPLFAAWTSRADWGEKAAQRGLFIGDPAGIPELRHGRTAAPDPAPAH